MASDIFSLLGISNIAEWMERWIRLYKSAISTFIATNGEKEADRFFQDHMININPDEMTRYIGYSIQQYSKRKFKAGERPTRAYEQVIGGFHN